MANSLANKKKEIFYEMYGARPFYVFLESLSFFGSFFDRAHEVTQKALQPELVSRVRHNIAAHRKMALDHLAGYIARVHQAEG